MPHDVTMPQLGMAQDAGKIVSWLKSPGDKVAKGDALFEVETDKAVMEVEAQTDGYLVGVTAAEGDDVPVGQVIARISDNSDDPVDKPSIMEQSTSTAPATDDIQTAHAADATDLPEGRTVTMPQLGMAQDSGLIVAWLISPGNKVVADETLFEVETDKSTMEVPAGMDGYLAATLAEPGEDVPVGQAVAIISTEKPAKPVARKVGAAPAAPAPDTAPAPAPEKPVDTIAASKAAPTSTLLPGGRILASPKARRLALERGLDLERLVQAGYPQPYHVADLDALAALPADKPVAAPQAAATSLHLTAVVAQDGFTAFAEWAAKAHDLTDADALLAGLAGVCLPGADTVRVDVERVNLTRRYAVARSGALSRIESDAEGLPDLILRDLRATTLRHVQMGAEATPVISILTSETGLALSLEVAAGTLSAQEALYLLSEFSGKMEQPLRHLL